MPVDTPQRYSKGSGETSTQLAGSRSAASPLSPTRAGLGAGTTYSRFEVSAAREAPHRYVQQSAYGMGQIEQIRENTYGRTHQVTAPPPPPPGQSYHRTTTQPVQIAGIINSSNNNNNNSSNTSNSNINNNNSNNSNSSSGNNNNNNNNNSNNNSNNNNNNSNNNNNNSNNNSSSSNVTNIPVSSIGSVGPPMETVSSPVAPPGRQRISLMQSAAQHPNEYTTNVRPPQPAPDPGGQPFKKLRLSDANHLSSLRQLKIDTREHRPATTEAYHPQVEAISPTLPNDNADERRPTKDDLLLQIHKVDMEIVNAENTMAMLKKKEESLEEASSKPSKVEEPSEIPPKHRSLAQKIYAENKKRAAEEHAVLATLGPPVELPLYNQPSDVEICQQIIQRHQSFKSRLLLHIRKIKSERAARNTLLVEKYAQLSQEWLKRVEKIESSAKRKAKEAKNREFFEKVFTELRKQREDKERFNRVGSRIKSEADLEEIMDGLQEQAMEDKKMRSYAVIPPLMLDVRQRRYIYANENGIMTDMVLDFKERQNINVWTAGEKEIFKEKFLQHPKNFGAIAASLDRKSAQDCVRYYYLSKKTENYKQLLRKSRQRTRSSRNPQKSQQVHTQCIVDSLTTGVTTRLQREQQQRTGGRDRSAQSTAASITVSTTTSATISAQSLSTTNFTPHITDSQSGSNTQTSTSSVIAPTSVEGSRIAITTTNSTMAMTSSTSDSTTTMVLQSTTVTQQVPTSNPNSEPNSTTSGYHSTASGDTSGGRRGDYSFLGESDNILSSCDAGGDADSSSGNKTSVDSRSFSYGKGGNADHDGYSNSKQDGKADDNVNSKKDDPTSNSGREQMLHHQHHDAGTVIDSKNSNCFDENTANIGFHQDDNTGNSDVNNSSHAVGESGEYKVCSDGSIASNNSNTNNNSHVWAESNHMSDCGRSRNVNDYDTTNRNNESGNDSDKKSETSDSRERNSDEKYSCIKDHEDRKDSNNAFVDIKMKDGDFEMCNVSTMNKVSSGDSMDGTSENKANSSGSNTASNKINVNSDNNGSNSTSINKGNDKCENINSDNNNDSNVDNDQRYNTETDKRSAENENKINASTSNNNKNNESNITAENKDNNSQNSERRTINDDKCIVDNAISNESQNIHSSICGTIGNNSIAGISINSSSNINSNNGNRDDKNANDDNANDNTGKSININSINCSNTIDVDKNSNENSSSINKRDNDPNNDTNDNIKGDNAFNNNVNMNQHASTNSLDTISNNSLLTNLNGVKTDILATTSSSGVVNLSDVDGMDKNAIEKFKTRDGICKVGVRMPNKYPDNSNARQSRMSRPDFPGAMGGSINLSTGTSDGAAMECREKLYQCFVCKAEACSRTRPLKKGKGQLYGILDDLIPVGARVCNTCQCKSVRNRHPSCPIPTCPNPKDRAKRLHNLPSRFFDLSPETRDMIAQEFQIPLNTTRCCSACIMRIRRKLDPQGNMMDDERRIALSDGDESDLSTSSCDEPDAASSDTASAESPNNPLRQPVSQKDKDHQQMDTTSLQATEGKAAAFENERLLPPLGQAPRKQKPQEEYDSSATETADEENENSPANRQSPKAISQVGQTGLQMVPPSAMPNGPQREQGSSSALNVREIVFNFIERSLKTTGPPKAGPIPLIKPANSMESKDISFVREYRNDMLNKQPSSTTSAGTVNVMQVQQPRQMHNQMQSNQSQNESLATLSVVNANIHSVQQMLPHSHGIITTVTPNQQQKQSSMPFPMQEQQKEEQFAPRNEPEPQTLDLSIKKRDISVNIQSAQMKQQQQQQQQQHQQQQQQHSGAPISIYRPEQNSQSPQTSQSSGFMSYRHTPEMSRSSKSPMYVPQPPVPVSISQQQFRTVQHPPPQVTLAVQHQPPQMQSKPKVNPKLSPKVIQQSVSPSQISGSGPKGSIIHGTPLNSQQILMPSSSKTLSPRFDSMLKQQPSAQVESTKLGSITQGTPVHLPSHHMQEKQRVYEYYKSNRQSPAQQASGVQPPSQPQQSSPQAQNFVGPPYSRPVYTMEMSPQLSSRQIVMHDYITSQQMHGQQGRSVRSDKESPSPKGSNMSSSSSSMYYSDKDRGRADYLSRTSPAEHSNSTPSPHRTPPPQRQGVIQRHNTVGPKPPSPSPNRLHIMQHHYPPPGHEAFSSFVDVAVQQPQLPVPQKEEKRGNISLPSGDHVGPPSHHDVRYQQLTRDPMAMQINHQHQQPHFRQHQVANSSVVDMQRRQEQLNRDRMHTQHERDRERQERERERYAQERLQPDRDRMEKERDRERERERDQRRAEEQDREERRRMFSNAPTSGGGFVRGDSSSMGRTMVERERDLSMGGRQASDTTFSASILIDAIIKHSINQGTSSPPSALSRQQFYAAREPSGALESEGKPNSPNVINVELDREMADRGRQHPAVKSITLGELTDSIIAKDYGPNPVMPLRQAYMAYPPQDSIVSTEQWKFNRRMQKEGEVNNIKISSTGRSNTPDERQIIRMAQPQSPRSKFREIVMPPENHFYSSGVMGSGAGNPPPPVDRRPGGNAGSNHPFALDCYVKNRIVEAMRTEDDRRSDDCNMHNLHERQDAHRQSSSHDKDSSLDCQPGRGVSKLGGTYDDDRRCSGSGSMGGQHSLHNSEIRSSQPPYSSQPQELPLAPVTTFATTTYAYPFSALNVPGPPPSSSIPNQSKLLDTGSLAPPPPQQSIAAEPKPLLSAQYEALSDED